MKKANFFVIFAKNSVNFVNGYFDGEFYYYKCDPEKIETIVNGLV